jgi:predicted membrane protein
MSVFDAKVGAGGLKLIGIGNADASEMRIVGDVGDIALDLGGRWQRDLRVAVISVVGAISITAPPTIGVELESTGLLSRDDVDGTFTRRGDVWRSANYEQSAVKVRVSVRSLLGKVTLIQR